MAEKLSQFVKEVVNFSSQYGTQGSHSYTACNLEGELRIYDGYGDRTEAFVLRTYGLWWQKCPSAAPKLRNSGIFRSQDFVEVGFEVPVVPTAIDIYETYHPGAAVRILACNANPLSTQYRKRQPGEVEWVTLWSGPTQCSNDARSRKFSPSLRRITFPTNLLRLEFNSEQCAYYTELDGIQLHGYTQKDLVPFRDRAIGFQMSVTNRLLKLLSLSDRQISTGDDEDDDDMNKWGYFSMLPDELIQCIFQYLDLRSLCSAAQACSLFLKNAYDPLLYKELDLQPYWNTVDDIALNSVSARCHKISNLNLSWTGGGGQVTEESVCRLLKQCGNGLVTLKLACCKYIGEETLSTMGTVCTSLEALDLQSSLQLNTALHHIGQLHHIRRLNLYSCRISAILLDIIGRNCQALEHFNIGASIKENSVEDSDLNRCVANLKKLVSLDLWRCKFASSKTIVAIAECCKHLEEIDIGWCHQVLRVQFNHRLLFGSCRKLKKVFLTSGRIIDDACLESVATFCPGIEQLDILGSNRVTKEGVERVLQTCGKLQLFDLSFCSKVTNLADFEVKYPKVAFKNSFQ